MNFRGNRAHKRAVAQNWAVLGLMALCLPAVALDAPTTYVWDSGGQLSIARPTAWGNGATSMARNITYNGDDVLQMTTRNFSEGAVFDFTPPVNLADYQKDGFIRLRLRFRDSTAPAAVPGFIGEGAPPEGAPAFFGAPQILPPRVNLQQRPGFGGQGGVVGQPGFVGEGGVAGEGGFINMVPLGPPPQETQLRRLQLTFVLERGVMTGFVDIPADLEKIKPDENGWRLFLLAVKDLRSTPNAQGMAQRLILTGDKEDTLFLAQAALVIETGQMQISLRRPTDLRGAQVAEITVRPGQVTLVADVEAGTADPVIEWNFDADNVNPDLIPTPPEPLPGAVGPEGFPVGPEGAPVANPEGGFVAPVIPQGPIVHARGLVAKFEYPNEEQDYRLEVTVTDRAGKKAPVKASLLIHVRG